MVPGCWFLVSGFGFPSLKPKVFIHEKTRKDTKFKKSEEDACARIFRAIRVPSWINPASCLILPLTTDYCLRTAANLPTPAGAGFSQAGALWRAGGCLLPQADHAIAAKACQAPV